MLEADERDGRAVRAAATACPSGGEPAADPAIETNGLRKVYGRFVAVDHLTLTVPRGEVFGYLGPNGAGKTTSVKMLLGLVTPTAGTLAARARIGFLPEQFRFHEWMKATEFLDFHGELYGMPTARRRRRIDEVLMLVGLTGRGHDRLRTFSKGMLQRIGLAQAILNEPELVFLDEPTSALDPLGRRDVRDIIRTLKAQGMTVFLNSHLLSEVEMVCDRVAFVHHGRVARLGRLAELLHEAVTLEVTVGAYGPALVSELGRHCQVIATEVGQLTLLVESQATIPAIVDQLVAAGVPIFGVVPRRRSLEDLFIDIVEGPTAEPPVAAVAAGR
jgi:ABC-2 type transport system ATP-binding protein